MKYLELIKGQFTADHEARAKQEEPYVAYSEEAGVVMYTVIPEPVTGPADNEIWYTSFIGKTTPDTDAFDVSIVSSTYGKGKGIITFDGDVTSIGESAFMDYVSYTSITIPNSVTSIGDRAFAGCSSLTSITFGGTMEEWNSVTKGSKWNDKVPATYVQCTDGQVTL